MQRCNRRSGPSTSRWQPSRESDSDCRDYVLPALCERHVPVSASFDRSVIAHHGPEATALMLRLFPTPGAHDTDADTEFWVPDPGRQHVRAVMVASADGAAQADGQAKGLSGRADEALFAVLRSHADVLLVGSGTARAERYAGERPEGPRAKWRAAHGLSEAPPIAVVTASCDLDPDGPLFTDTVARPIVITCSDAPQVRIASLADRADVIVTGAQQVNVKAALDALAERGLRRVSCEGGPRLLAQVVATDRLDELTLSLSPLLLAGGADRILNGPPLAHAQQLRLTAVLTEDDFLFLRYTRATAQS